MLDEGLYQVAYKAEKHADRGCALAVLRSGKILGSDRWGGIFAGSYRFDTVSGTSTVHLRMQVPPGGVLISGFTAGPSGSMLELVTALERATPVSTATVDLGGEPVEVQLTYLGPVPN